MEENDIIFGKHPVLEALEMGKDVDKVYLQTGIRGALEKEVRKLCKQRDVPLQYVPIQKMDKITRDNHQGLIALVPLIKYQQLSNVVPLLFDQGKDPFIVLLDGISDVRNLGAVARSAEVLGADAIVIPQKGGASVNGVAIKASAGALNRIAVCREANIPDAIQQLQASGIEVWAAEIDASETLHDVDWKKPMAVVLGSEGQGISKFTREVIDGSFKIPQLGKTDSLNVSVAGGIIFYEVVMQRMTKK